MPGPLGVLQVGWPRSLAPVKLAVYYGKMQFQKNLGLLATTALCALLVACSGDSTGDNRMGTGGAGGSGTGGAVGNGGGAGGGPTCTLAGAACASSAECCTEYCDPDFAVCSIEAGACTEAAGSCSVGAECCSGACVNGTCSTGQCVSDGESCGSDGECCGGDCGDDNTCVALNPSCNTLGNSCTVNSDCCSAFCDEDGLCATEASFCTQTGDVCVSGAQCCGGVCDKAEGAELGLCGVALADGAGNDCLVAGEVCGGVYESGMELACNTDESKSCCSRSCAPFGPTGIMICQPASGCRPTGEICREDTDCCGADGLPNGSPQKESSNVVCSKSPGATIGRCANWNQCNPAGNTCRLATIECSQEARCCSGNAINEETCHPDALGIPRCTIAVGGPDCTDPSALAGNECASSADCCGLPCVPNPEGGFVCGGACVPDGGDCSTTSDCCSGLICEIPSGQSSGTCGTPSEDPPPGEDVCAEFGQACGPDIQCCNNVECNEAGTCGVQVIVI